MSVLDQIIGCGQRNGQKYFLVRFKGHDRNEIIHWETAKEYSVEVMEFFGSRTVWTDIHNIIDPDVDDDIQEEEQAEDDQSMNRPSTSQQLDSFPNEIEFEE